MYVSSSQSPHVLLSCPVLSCPSASRQLTIPDIPARMHARDRDHDHDHHEQKLTSIDTEQHLGQNDCSSNSLFRDLYALFHGCDPEELSPVCLPHCQFQCAGYAGVSVSDLLEVSTAHSLSHPNPTVQRNPVNKQDRLVSVWKGHGLIWSSFFSPIKIVSAAEKKLWKKKQKLGLEKSRMRRRSWRIRARQWWKRLRSE